MRYIFNDGDKNFSVRILKYQSISDHVKKYVVENDLDNKRSEFFIRNLAGEMFISLNGIEWEKTAFLPLNSPYIYKDKTFEIFRGFIPSGKQGQVGGALKTQMPGKVVRVLALEGQMVKAGEPLLILEAMKMENEMKSPKNGKIKKIYIKEGMVLDAGFLLMEIEES